MPCKPTRVERIDSLVDLYPNNERQPIKASVFSSNPELATKFFCFWTMHNIIAYVSICSLFGENQTGPCRPYTVAKPALINSPLSDMYLAARGLWSGILDGTSLYHMMQCLSTPAGEQPQLVREF
jgi:hypothetical protein